MALLLKFFPSVLQYVKTVVFRKLRNKSAVFLHTSSGSFYLFEIKMRLMQMRLSDMAAVCVTVV
jgi:hypothetical protein